MAEILAESGMDSVSIWQATAVCVSTIITFYILGGALTVLGKPRFVSASVEFWKWRNIFVSWIHGVVCGGWDFLCIVLYPDLLWDPVEFINNFSYLLIPFSAGYFIYDFIDLVQNKRLREHWEIGLHHVIIVTSFVYNFITKRCVGYNVIALMAEINSIFLHLRKLLQMCNVGYRTWLFQSVSIINLFTFVTFRLFPIARIFAGLYLDFHRVPLVYILTFCFTLTTGAVINFILFWRLVKSDVIKGWSRSGRSKNHSSGQQKNGTQNGIIEPRIEQHITKQE